MRTSLSGENEDEQVGRADSGLHFQKPRTAFFLRFSSWRSWFGEDELGLVRKKQNEDEQVGLR